MHLRDALADRSQFTRYVDLCAGLRGLMFNLSWFPIVGGLGWGRIRISLLWKPIDISLPPGVSGYEIATLEVLSMSATDVGKHTERNLSVTIETETDKFTLAFPVPGDDIDGHRSSLSINSMMPPATTPSSIKTNDLTELEWEITKPIRLAVEYRHSCSVLVSFVTRSSVLKKKRVIGLATIRLNDCPDGEECHQTVPIFATAEVKEAMHAAVQYHALRNGGESRQAATHAQDDEAKLIGFVSLSFVIHPGVSRAHRKMCKRDLRFKNAYEAWEAAKEVHRDQKQTSVGEILRSNKHKVANGEDEESDESDSEDEYDVESVRRRDGAGEAVPGQAMIDDQDEEDAKEFMPVQKAHSHALHKRVRVLTSLFFPFRASPSCGSPCYSESSLSDPPPDGFSDITDYFIRTRASSNLRSHAAANSSRTRWRPSSSRRQNRSATKVRIWTWSLRDNPVCSNSKHCLFGHEYCTVWL